ncbi:hypothetical protein CR513_56016, partial [Mucuna pruriens]
MQTPKFSNRLEPPAYDFPPWSLSARKPETDEDLLKMFRRVEINVLLLDAIEQVPNYAKFLKELCIHKRKKLKVGAEVGGVLSAFIQKEVTVGTQPSLPRKCKDPRIFSAPCTIGRCSFVDAMLDLGASINFMPALVYKSLNFGDLEPTADFYVLDMEEKTFGNGSTLILGRPFFMTARTKIDVYAGTLSMEFEDNLVQFNIFEVMKHPPEDHSLCRIDMIEKLVKE